MSERRPPRPVDPVPRIALLARALARPRPGLVTVVFCALALAASAADGARGPRAVPVTADGASATVRHVQAPATTDRPRGAVHRARGPRAAQAVAGASATPRHR
jgi:hypothetical protein